jgi:hypothetical protein
MLTVLAAASELEMPTAMNTSCCCLSSPSKKISYQSPYMGWHQAAYLTIFRLLLPYFCDYLQVLHKRLSHHVPSHVSLIVPKQNSRALDGYCLQELLSRQSCLLGCNVLKTAYACSTYLSQFNRFSNCSFAQQQRPDTVDSPYLHSNLSLGLVLCMGHLLASTDRLHCCTM